MNKFKRKPIILFIAALIILYVIIYIVPKVTGAMVSSYTIGYGELKLSDETTAVFVRDETVFTAAAGGKTNYYIDDGTLVRRGTTIMEVTGGNDGQPAAKYTDMLNRLGDAAVSTGDYAISKGGIISYYADGYEQKIRPDNMEKGGYSFYSKLSQDDVLELSRKSVEKGEPVFKVVDRTKWYMVCFVEKDHGDRYQNGDEITVEFEDDSITAQVYSKKKMGDKVRVILVTDSYYKKYDRLRTAPVHLVTYNRRGLIVENASIGKEKGVPGVYVRNKTNDYFFVPVKIYATDGKYSLVADGIFYDKDGKETITVEIYDEILKEAKK